MSERAARCDYPPPQTVMKEKRRKVCLKGKVHPEIKNPVIVSMLMETQVEFRRPQKHLWSFAALESLANN